ncbi:MAG: diaminopropionate ammonia-lyase [Alphaproteobacteria bacterium]
MSAGVVLRPAPRHGAWPSVLDATISAADVFAARAEIGSWEGYAPTPLRSLPRLAAALGVEAVLVKDEGMRFGAVGSFKALGPPLAFARAVARLGAAPGRCTAVAATSGNHGRALAWGAARMGAACRIFMPAHTSRLRGEAIAALGAEVVRVPGNFDAALDAAIAEARRGEGRVLVADVEFEGAARVARDTMAGYAVLGDELLDAHASSLPSHVFVAAGNGTLAAATCARLWQGLGASRPLLVSAEPETSDCLRRSLAAGRATTLADAGGSVMDGLVVGTPSRVAWPVLAAGLDAAATVRDADAVRCLRDLAAGTHGDAPLAIGETGIAAIATLCAAALDQRSRHALGIGPASRLLAIACEGVTDREVFERLVA